MRILHVITRSEWGGAQNVVYQLAKAQYENGHHVEVMCGEQGRLVRELQEVGIPVHMNHYLQRGFGIKDLRAALVLWQRCTQGFDLLHAHSSKAGILARLIARQCRISLCFTVHGFGISSDHPRWKQVLYHGIEREFARLTDALVFVSKADETLASTNGWVKNAKLSTVIYNGVDLPGMDSSVTTSRMSKSRSRKKMGIPDEAYVISNLARVVWIKNPEFWLTVAERYLTQDPEGYFIWFGGGDAIPRLQEKITPALRNRIVFWGEIENIDEAFDGMDVLFLTSRSEGMPLAVIEGMIRHKAILAPALPGLNDVLAGECGLTFSPGDINQAVAALHRLKYRDERLRLGQKGYDKALQNYTVDQMVRRYENVYQSIRNKVWETKD